MKFAGGKFRLAKHLLPIILEGRESEPYIEPFVGGANMICQVGGKRYGYDANKYLIAMWKKVQQGWIPKPITEKKFKDIWHNKDKYPPHEVAFAIHGCSFYGGWQSGFLDKAVTYTINSLKKQAPLIKGVKFSCKDYKEVEIPKGSFVYCDPPYKGTDSSVYLTTIDHEEFWDWVRNKSKIANVFVSELQAPKDFDTIFKKKYTSSISGAAINKATKRVEKLFQWKGSSKNAQTVLSRRRAEVITLLMTAGYEDYEDLVEQLLY